MTAPVPTTPADALADEIKRLGDDVEQAAAAYFCDEDDAPSLAAPYRAAKAAMHAAIERLRDLANAQRPAVAEPVALTDEVTRASGRVDGKAFPHGGIEAA